MLRDTGRLKLWMSGCSEAPASVLAVKYRYLPSASNTGVRASLMPSVTWVLLPSPTE